MLKLLNTAAFYKEDEPSVTMLDLSQSLGGLEKKAAHEDIHAYVSTLQPKPGFTYLHINAMTAGEYHGANRNADYFPEENLKKYYKTFETTPAYVYRSHINKDPKRSYGKVLFAIYNERMHRVELICECPDELVEDINARIEAGDFPTTSMACRTPFDTCSICGNRAKSRNEYCSHLKTELNRLYPDGRKVYAINDGPLTFFDISIVIRPADVNSSILQKVAYDASVIGSAELADIEGLTDDGFHKRAAFKKLSELIKEITDGCYVVGAYKSPAQMLGSADAQDLPLALVDKLHHFELSHVLKSMANLDISPSISFLAELIARKKLGEGYEGIGSLVESVIHEAPHDVEVPLVDLEEGNESSAIATSILKPYAAGSSLDSAAVEKRASNIGFIGNGPHIEPRPDELKKNEELSNVIPDGIQSVSYTKLLLNLGAAALLAKYFITREIDRKFREHGVGSKNNVKIVIVKKASDYLVTSQLAKLAMTNALPAKKNEEKGSGPGVGGLGMSVTKRMLRNSSSPVGGKLANLLRALSLGSKVTQLSENS